MVLPLDTLTEPPCFPAGYTPVSWNPVWLERLGEIDRRSYAGTIDAALYRRVTTITDSPGGACGANCKLVQVTVFYRPVTGQGQLDQERRLDVVTMLVARS